MDARKVGGLVLAVVSSVAGGIVPILLKGANRAETHIVTGVLLASTLLGVGLTFLPPRPSAGKAPLGDVAGVGPHGVAVQGTGNTVNVTHAEPPANSNDRESSSARAGLSPMVTPEMVEKLYDDFTGLQARLLAKVYDGRLMRVAGSIEDVREPEGGGIWLDLARPDRRNLVHCRFAAKDATNLEVLPKGCPVVIVGALDLTRALVTLTDCELESVRD